VQDRQLRVDDALDPPREVEYLTWARVLIAQHRPAEAAPLLGRAAPARVSRCPWRTARPARRRVHWYIGTPGARRSGTGGAGGHGGAGRGECGRPLAGACGHPHDRRESGSGSVWASASVPRAMRWAGWRPRPCCSS
jgi:hypothetical protein